MTTSLQQIQTRIKSIAARNPIYTGISQWVGDLLSITVKASDNFRPVELKFDAAAIPMGWHQGKPLIQLEELVLDWDQAKDLYKQLVEQIKITEDGRKQAGGLIQALDKDTDGTPILMKSILTSDFDTIQTIAKELSIDPPVLILLLRLSLRPALLEVAQAVQDRLDLDHWHHGHCPVCGSAPILADLSGEGGKRTLHCSLCETAWPYTRLRCPFCENDNRDDLGYLRAENEEGLRVDLCDRCGNYLKTIDLRELSGPIIVPLDDAATWHLDLIAQENLAGKEIKRS
ncbi:MAG: formate dehydrogenase accessory protein FdhE [Desulfobacterales bacterium]|nr:MAG: formate dehydrogenase accessory protein FdhE [Desulfobacterales bacterium]